MQRRAATRHALRRSISSLRILLLALVLLAGLASYGCAASCKPPKTHIVMAEKNGGLFDPEADRKLEPSEYDGYVDEIFKDLGAYCGKKPLEPCKVLLYFHGGLNTRKAAIDRAATLTEPILESGSYPIFVNWDSSLPSSWWDHASHIYKGLYVGGKRVPFTPYFVAADEIKSIADTGVDWLAEWRHTFPTRQGAGKNGLQVFAGLIRNHETGNGPRIDLNADLLDTEATRSKEPRLVDRRTFGDRWLPRLTLIPTLPTKLLAPPILIQAAGTGAWSVLQRRTETLFRTEAEFRGASREAVEAARSPGAAAEKRDGQTLPETEVALAKRYDTGAALAYFINRFKDDFEKELCEKGYFGQHDDHDKTYVVPVPEDVNASASEKEEAKKPAACVHPVELTLVGHSMGTLIIDRLLRYRRDLDVKNIVFMAGATTIGDYSDTIHPYLEDHGDPRCDPKRTARAVPNCVPDPAKGTQMYHLVLHPLAEYGERGFWDLSPRASLLVWIDNYFSDPISPLGRRVGRFANLVPELAHSDGVGPQVHLKVFQVGSPVKLWNPQKHGDFGDFPFWDPKFWDPKTPTVPGKDGTPVARYTPCQCKKPGAHR